MAPAGTPGDIVAKLNATYANAVADPEIRRRLIELGMEPTPCSPQELAAYIKSETVKWGKLIAENRIKVE